ncbi:HesA/MoeB/ThiF family protein, partial [Corynebacterium amycolatum]|uniref:HesA/MoeB/ThiF family protein n=1 Tax=Corynebacterium amycolatum TaxID=43765 RepID=UPI00211A4728
MTNSEISSSDLVLSDRYRRQVSLPGFGLNAQKTLAEAHVLCIGAGGLGSPALQYLAAAGTGHITIVDDDVVELSNLHRQIIHTTDDIGKNKVDSAGAHIAAINPDTVVETHARRLDREFAVELCARADVVFRSEEH